MKEKDKQLLLNDLCARMPYNVICQFTWTYCNETTNGEDVIAKENDNIRGIDINTKEVQAAYYGEWVDLEHCKPYLRSISELTDKEIYEWHKITSGQRWITFTHAKSCFNWLNKHHVDYKGLIKKGLAIEAPEDMYKTE